MSKMFPNSWTRIFASYNRTVAENRIRSKVCFIRAWDNSAQASAKCLLIRDEALRWIFHRAVVTVRKVLPGFDEVFNISKSVDKAREWSSPGNLLKAR